jgi:hypothetical protein
MMGDGNEMKEKRRKGCPRVMVAVLISCPTCSLPSQDARVKLNNRAQLVACQPAKDDAGVLASSNR